MSDTNNGDPDLFSSFAGVNPSGNTATVMVLNKDPNNTVQTQFTWNGFTPKQVTTYTLASTDPTQIVASSTQAWSATMSFAPYTATLLVVSGTSQLPTAEWDPNPDTTMTAAGTTVMLHPKIASGTGTITLGAPQSDSGIAVTITQPNVSSGKRGSVKVTAGQTPGFYHYSIPGTDNAGLVQNEGGWIVVGNPPATLSKTGNNQKGAPGSQLNLSVTLNASQSGGNAAGGTIFFTTSAGTLSSRIVTTDSSGNAPVVLTLPSSPGTVHVTAEGQYGLGHPAATFTEISQ